MASATDVLNTFLREGEEVFKLAEFELAASINLLDTALELALIELRMRSSTTCFASATAVVVQMVS